MTVRMRRRGVARVFAMLTAAVVAVTTLGACVPDGGAGSESPELRLYTGPIPEPAPLVANAGGGATLPEPPEPPADVSDEQAWADYEAAMQKYLEEAQAYSESMQEASGDMATFATQVYELVEATRTSDEASVAAWQSLLVASGIAVGYGDEAVEVSGMEGAGIPMTTAELRLHALLGASTTRIPLAELAYLIGGLGVFDETDLAQALYDDLSGLAATGFGTVFMALDPDVFTTMRQGQPQTVPLDEMMLTGAQAALILRKLSVDLLQVTEDGGGIDAAIAAVRASDGAGSVVPAGFRAPAIADGPCGTEERPWEAEGRRNISKGLGWAFGEVIGRIPGYDYAKTTLAAAQAVLGIASVLAKMMLMQSDFRMGDAPLVRTKDRTAGERRELAVALTYPTEALEDVRKCLSGLLAPFGFDLSDHSTGAASGVDVELQIEGNRLQYSSERSGTSVFRQQTGQNGIATFPIVGAPQAERLPSGAEPEEVTVPVRVDANVEGSDLVKDLVAAGWEAVGQSVGGMIAGVAGRMKLVVFTWEVPVRDWKLVGDFDVTLTGELWSHSGYHETRSADCGTFTTNESTTTSGAVDTPDSARVTAHYVTEVVDGSPVSGLVIYPAGSGIDQLKITREGAELLHFPVSYSATRTESEPGTAPMPPHYTDPHFGSCGDGIGGWTPPVPDCGPRDYLGLASLVLADGTVRVLGNPGDKQWEHCGTGLSYANPLMPPASMGSCAGAVPSGGEVPSVDAVFGERGWFEISGSLSCSRDREGTLHRFTFDWTLKFCRVVEGEPSESC